MRLTGKLKRRPTFDIAAHLVDVLNVSPKKPSDEDIQQELRHLVDTWHRSGRNTAKMNRDHPELLPIWGKGVYMPTRTGRVKFQHLPAAISEGTPKSDAQVVFLQFLVDSSCERRYPAGPCAYCGKYFLKTTRHEKIYCKGHGSAVTARAAMKKRQAQERVRFLTLAQAAIRKYERLGKRSDWKTFVETETGFTRRRLSIAVKKGWIKLPKGHTA